MRKKRLLSLCCCGLLLPFRTFFFDAAAAAAELVRREEMRSQTVEVLSRQIARNHERESKEDQSGCESLVGETERFSEEDLQCQQSPACRKYRAEEKDEKRIVSHR